MEKFSRHESWWKGEGGTVPQQHEQKYKERKGKKNDLPFFTSEFI